MTLAHRIKFGASNFTNKKLKTPDFLLINTEHTNHHYI